MFRINVHSPFHAAVEAARQMPNGGRIIVIGSVHGDPMPIAGLAAHAPSKSATQAMARGLAGPEASCVSGAMHTIDGAFVA